jgi:Helicase associated domain
MQRKQYHRYQKNLSSGMDQERIDRLNELGFAWDAQEAAWDRQMKNLRSFHRFHGHCNVSSKDTQYPSLYQWMREQRRHYKWLQTGEPSLLTKARMEALESVNFSFDSFGATFSTRLQELTEFRRIYGHCNVPPHYSESSKLFLWVQRMRSEYKLKSIGENCILRQPHIHALNELDFNWTSSDTSNEGNAVDSSDDDSSVSTNGENDDGDDGDSYTSDDVSTSSSSILKTPSSKVDFFDSAQGRPFKKHRFVM